MQPLPIPDKVFFKIGEVSRITELKPYVLRYWETEFPFIRPTKTKTNQRVYERCDIETILLIKKLLYEEKFTIEGARSRLKELRGQRESEGKAKTKEPIAAPEAAEKNLEIEWLRGLSVELRRIVKQLDTGA